MCTLRWRRLGEGPRQLSSCGRAQGRRPGTEPRKEIQAAELPPSPFSTGELSSRPLSCLLTRHATARTHTTWTDCSSRTSQRFCLTSTWSPEGPGRRGGEEGIGPLPRPRGEERGPQGLSAEAAPSTGALPLAGATWPPKHSGGPRARPGYKGGCRDKTGVTQAARTFGSKHGQSSGCPNGRCSWAARAFESGSPGPGRRRHAPAQPRPALHGPSGPCPAMVAGTQARSGHSLFRRWDSFRLFGEGGSRGSVRACGVVGKGGLMWARGVPSPPPPPPHHNPNSAARPRPARRGGRVSRRWWW